MYASKWVLLYCLSGGVCGVVPVCFAAVRCDRPGSSPWHPYTCVFPSLVASSTSQPKTKPAKPPPLRTLNALGSALAGLAVTAGIVNGSWEIWRVLCADGHGPSHCLQQCAGLRPQHWRWHGPERHHYCKWWRLAARIDDLSITHTNTHTNTNMLTQQTSRADTLFLQAKSGDYLDSCYGGICQPRLARSFI